MSDALAAMREADQLEDLDKFVQADGEFHYLIARGAQNEVLETVLSAMRETLTDAMREFTRPTDRARILETHGWLLDAIAREDPLMAQQVAAVNISDMREALARVRSEVPSDR
jgi:DNA-binding FadR family transcriptional regulator